MRKIHPRFNLRNGCTLCNTERYEIAKFDKQKLLNTRNERKRSCPHYAKKYFWLSINYFHNYLHMSILFRIYHPELVRTMRKIFLTVNYFYNCVFMSILFRIYHLFNRPLPSRRHTLVYRHISIPSRVYGKRGSLAPLVTKVRLTFFYVKCSRSITRG